jgi:hypothetical protein
MLRVVVGNGRLATSLELRESKGYRTMVIGGELLNNLKSFLVFALGEPVLWCFLERGSAAAPKKAKAARRQDGHTYI